MTSSFWKLIYEGKTCGRIIFDTDRPQGLDYESESSIKVKTDTVHNKSKNIILYLGGARWFILGDCEGMGFIIDLGVKFPFIALIPVEVIGILFGFEVGPSSFKFS